ncbi:hypothetical protein Scep_026080 [Stephania cephalantha]|uniref:Uncharacterized protein n=1 Tax=Stephania cephalantha TaxID=152367 RepID=A0AAP0EJF9_9MAGN
MEKRRVTLVAARNSHKLRNEYKGEKKKEKNREERERKRDRKKKWRRGRDRAGEEEEEGVARRSDPAANQRIRRRTGISRRRLAATRGRGRWLQRGGSPAGRAALQHRTRGSIGAQQQWRTAGVDRPARRRDGEPARSSDMAAAPARTSCGVTEHRFGWRDAATPAVTPAARHRRGGSDACAASASGGAGDWRAAAAATAARQRQRRL